MNKNEFLQLVNSIETGNNAGVALRESPVVDREPDNKTQDEIVSAVIEGVKGYMNSLVKPHQDEGWRPAIEELRTAIEELRAKVEGIPATVEGITETLQAEVGVVADRQASLASELDGLRCPGCSKLVGWGLFTYQKFLVGKTEYCPICGHEEKVEKEDED